jgi:hypothetical protein
MTAMRVRIHSQGEDEEVLLNNQGIEQLIFNTIFQKCIFKTFIVNTPILQCQVLLDCKQNKESGYFTADKWPNYTEQNLGF